MTPLHLELLIGCLCLDKMPRLNTGTAYGYLADLKQWGAVELRYGHDVVDDGTNPYRLTELGRAWVQALCNVPAPKLVYMDEAGRILKT